MKAKEYKAKLDELEQEVGLEQAVATVLSMFADDIQSLVRQRGNKGGINKRVFESILKETNGKWEALCRLDDRLNPLIFQTLVEAILSELVA